jgi:serine/threonine-protein kinase
MKVAPGSEVTKSIRLVQKLDDGGFGSVWVADHLALKTRVAVKFLCEEALGDQAAVARFAREAEAAARIRSAHVVQVFDYGTASGVPYIVMELLEGEDLQARLARVGPLDFASTTRIVEQVAKALTKAHAMGVIHRDIKPGNIFLTNLGDEGEIFVKVLDFGLAKLGSESGVTRTRTDAIFGTPAYMSPEQGEAARNVTPRSDLWSLAVVAYHALTGVLPFASSSLMGLVVAIHEARFESPRQFRKDLPAAVDAFFARALRREPEERFASAAELAAALRAALET